MQQIKLPTPLLKQHNDAARNMTEFFLLRFVISIYLTILSWILFFCHLSIHIPPPVHGSNKCRFIYYTWPRQFINYKFLTNYQKKTNTNQQVTEGSDFRNFRSIINGQPWKLASRWLQVSSPPFFFFFFFFFQIVDLGLIMAKEGSCKCSS